MSEKQQNSRQTTIDLETLRKRAEEQVRTMEPTSLSSQTPESIQQMLYELRVHQIELEMQNEELRTVQAQIEAGRERYFDIFDQAPIGYIILNVQEVIVNTNLTVSTLLNIERGALINQPISKFILKEDQDIYYLHKINLLETGDLQTFELRMTPKDETIIWVQLTITAIEESDGTPVNRIVLSNITDRKRAEEDLKESEQKFRTLSNSGMALIWTSGTDKLCNYFNDIWINFTGRTIDQEMGTGWTEGVYPDDLQQCLDMYTKAFDRREKFSMEYRLRRYDGEYRWILDEGCPRYNSRNEFIGYIGHCLDITDRKLAEEEARSKDKQLSELSSRLPGLVFQFIARNDGTRTVVYVTGQVEKMLGLSPDPQDFFERFTAAILAEHRNDFLQNIEKTVRQGAEWNYEGEIQKPSGEILWISGIASPTKMPGSIIYDGVIVDITERKQAEAKLAETEEILRDILESTLSGFWDWNLVDNTEYLSPTFKRMFGYEDHEMESSPEAWQNIIFPEDLPGVIEVFDRHVKSRGLEPFYNEVRYRHRDGSTVWVICAGRIIKWAEDGTAIRMVGCHIDITARKQAEEELRRRENQLQRIFEILPIGLWFVDKDGTLLRGNPKGIEIWGAEPTVPLSEYGVFKAWRLPSHEPIEAHQWALTRTICNGETIVDELLEIESFDGKRKTILNYTAPVLDGDGRVDGAIVVNLDISDRKALEDRLLQAQKMESIGQLAGGVAHDFNNMLGVIIGYTEMALEEVKAGQPMNKDLHEIKQAAQRSADLTRQLLTFARKQTIAPKVIDINETVEGMLKMLRRLIGEDIDLIWLPGRNLGPVKVDPTQIDQVLANLCVNARDAIDGVGKVTIETALVSFDEDWCAAHTGVVPGEYVMLAVSDSGCGMDEETISHLFEPFFTTKEQGKGTGLGLASVYGAVTQNNGFINVYSEPGKGTTFKVYLPQHVIRAESLPIQVPVETAARGHETIFLVEDEPAILEMTTIMLERLGYTVVAAGTPGEAIRLARGHSGHIDLLMTDVVMPEMNGRDLAGEIASLYPGIKLLFMSGYPANIIAQKGVLDDGVAFIQKPFTKVDMAVKLREVLEDRHVH